MSTTPRPPQIIPYLFYSDIPAALDFLTRAFGFKEEMRVGTPSGGMHGEASFKGQLVMMGQGAHERSLKTPKAARRSDHGGVCLSRRRRQALRGRQSGGRGNRPSAKGRVLRPDLLGERSRGPSMVLHEPAEGGVAVPRPNDLRSPASRRETGVIRRPARERGIMPSTTPPVGVTIRSLRPPPPQSGRNRAGSRCGSHCGGSNCGRVRPARRSTRPDWARRDGCDPHPLSPDCAHVGLTWP